MFYAGIDMLFSILFPILFLVVLGMHFWQGYYSMTGITGSLV